MRPTLSPVSDPEARIARMLDERLRELERRIEEKMEEESKLTTFDQLLLFGASSVTTIFAILQVLTSGFKALLYFIPLMIAGFFMPVYVGYYGGAILDSRVERLRGLTYLLSGILGYLMASMLPLVVALGNWVKFQFLASPRGHIIAYVLNLVITAVVAGTYAISANKIKLFTISISKYLGIPHSKDLNKSIHMTVTSGTMMAYLSLGIALILGLLSEIIPTLPPVIVLSAKDIIFIIAFVSGIIALALHAIKSEKEAKFLSQKIESRLRIQPQNYVSTEDLKLKASNRRLT